MNQTVSNGKKGKTGSGLSAACLRNPLLEKLNAMVQELTGIDFLVVFPKEGQWGQVHLGREFITPPFCLLIQSSSDGAKHCKMCYILMSIAACRERMTEQRCHAGARVLVSPLASGTGECLAVLSSCTFAPNGHSKEAWLEIKARGEKLGVDPVALKEVYDQLPKLSQERATMVRGIMEITAEAAREIRMRHMALDALKSLQSKGTADSEMKTMIEEKLATAVKGGCSDLDQGPEERQKRTRLLIKMVADLVASRPAQPFSVASVAAAARVTPNHFSSLFHEHQGQCFTDYVTDKRMELAEELLRDLTLNITEVAGKSGYEDPGYFSRRFKRRTGVSPREWRESHTV